MLGIRIVLIALVLLAMPLAARRAAAQDESDLADPVVEMLDEQVRHFLDAVSSGDASDAFAKLLLGSQLREQEAAVRTLVEKSRDIPQRYGAYRESEQLGAKRIGKDLVLLKYLYKCERFPVIWYFVYYRDFSRPASATDDGWVVISVRFDTHVEDLFD